MDSLIDLKPVADVVNNLMDKLSSAVGWITNHPSLKTQAIELFVKEVKQGDLSPLEKAAYISNARKILKEYSNQRSIVAHAIRAIRAMSETAKPQDISDDFLSLLMDKARLVSDEDFQLIWGKILAEECNAPNSIPKALLHILSHMDKQDAERFASLCSVSVLIKDTERGIYCPIVIKSHLDDYYSKLGITYEALIDLQAIGLIQVDIDALGIDQFVSVNSSAAVYYHHNSYELPENSAGLYVGSVLYTKAGQALCRAIGASEQEHFLEKYCIPYWEKMNKT